MQGIKLQNGSQLNGCISDQKGCVMEI